MWLLLLYVVLFYLVYILTHFPTLSDVFINLYTIQSMVMLDIICHYKSSSLIDLLTLYLFEKLVFILNHFSFNSINNYIHSGIVHSSLKVL